MQFVDLYGTFLDRELGTADRTTLFTTARRQQAVNEAVLELNRLTECYRRAGTLTLVDAQGEYDLQAIASQTDFIRVAKEGIEVRHVDAGGNITDIAGDRDFPRHDVEWLNRYRTGWRTEPAGTPDLHYLRVADGQVFLGLVPAPNVQSGETWTATVPYVAIPPTLVNETDVPFTINGKTLTALTPFHRVIGHLAAAYCERFRKDTAAEAAQVQKASGYIQDYLNSQEQPKGPRQVRFARSYFREGRSHGWLRPPDPYRWP